MCFLRLKPCKFSAGHPFLHCFKNFPCVLRIYCFVAYRLSPIDSPLGLSRHCKITMQMGHCLVYVDHCGNDILFAIFPLAPRESLFQRLDCISSLSLVISPPSCTRWHHHLDCVLPNRFSAPPVSDLKRSSTRSHTFGHLFRFPERYCLSFGQARYFCLNVVDRVRTFVVPLCEVPPLTPLCFEVQKICELCCIISPCFAISFRIVYHQSVNRWITKCKSST